MKQISLIFIGTGEFGVPILTALANDSRFHIPFVITNQDKASGRGLKINASPIKECAELNKLVIHQSASTQEEKQMLVQIKPDFILVVSYGEIIKKNILDLASFGAVNIHGSLLPSYRGASPIQEALLHGDSKTGVTWILMNEKLDAGAIIAKEETGIYTDDDFPSLYERLAQLAGKCTPEILVRYKTNRKSEPQDENKATYCKKIKKEDGFIDVYKESAEEIIRKIKAYTPWPGCYIKFNGKRLKIIKARASEQKINSGEVRVNNKNILEIGTTSKAIIPFIVQPESKHQMEISAFLRGQKKLPEKL